MPNLEVAASFNLKCEGVADSKLSPLIEVNRPVQPSITVYSDGTREVGCALLDYSNGACRAADLFPGVKRVRCTQLYPLASKDRLMQVNPIVTANSPASIELNTFGEAIKYFSKRLGMKQSALAEFVRMDPTHLNKIIKGTRKPPRMETVLAQIQVLRLNPDEAKIFANLAGYHLDK